MAGMDYSGLPEEDELPNPYSYNGKEFQNELGLGWYDYGARFYDPQVGRWWSMDAMAEERFWVTPYNYVQNNPVIKVDLEGLIDDWYESDNGYVVYKEGDAKK